MNLPQEQKKTLLRANISSLLADTKVPFSGKMIPLLQVLSALCLSISQSKTFTVLLLYSFTVWPKTVLWFQPVHNKYCIHTCTYTGKVSTTVNSTFPSLRLYIGMKTQLKERKEDFPICLCAEPRLPLGQRRAQTGITDEQTVCRGWLFGIQTGKCSRRRWFQWPRVFHSYDIWQGRKKHRALYGRLWDD